MVLEIQGLLPPGHRFRELWLPENIVGTKLPSSVSGGHPLALSGARKGTTCEGVHFTGAADSNINCGALHNSATKLWISFRLKLDQGYSSGDGAKYLWGIWKGSSDYITIRFDNATGKILFLKADGGQVTFLIYSVATTWNAGQWYHVIASISSAEGARLVIDNGTAVTDGDTSAVCDAGDFVIGDKDDPGAGDGFPGVIADFFCEEGTDLSEAEEADLYNGIPPATVDNAYPLDEGRGVTAYDRGADTDDGTLDTTATWKFGQVKQPTLSLDGINDRGQSSAGVDISGDLTLVWVAKAKSTWDGIARDALHVYIAVDTNNRIIFGYTTVSDYEWLHVTGGGTAIYAYNTTNPAIDDYRIYLCTYDGDTAEIFLNGSSVLSAGSGAPISAGAATAYIGRRSDVYGHSIDKPLLVGLIDGVLSATEAEDFSRLLDKRLGLGIGV